MCLHDDVNVFRLWIIQCATTSKNKNIQGFQWVLWGACVHLNRDAAKRYRGRKKDYIEILLDRIDYLEEKNEKQSAELQRLKNDTAINIPLWWFFTNLLY